MILNNEALQIAFEGLPSVRGFIISIFVENDNFRLISHVSKIINFIYRPYQ